MTTRSENQFPVAPSLLIPITDEPEVRLSPLAMAS